MSDTPVLKLDWCSHAAAKYAVEHWHYSKSLPTPPLVKIGVWENAQFIGAVLFSRGATNNLGKPYRLSTTEICELTRVALRSHQTFVTRIIAIGIKFLIRRSPGLRLIISFADPEQMHIGAIYQAGNWLYLGMTSGYDKFQSSDGRIWHPRQVSASGIKKQYRVARVVPKIQNCKRIPVCGKYRYAYPLDAQMYRQLLPYAKPYPKRATSILADAPTVQAGESGAAPTVALIQ